MVVGGVGESKTEKNLNPTQTPYNTLLSIFFSFPTQSVRAFLTSAKFAITGWGIRDIICCRFLSQKFLFVCNKNISNGQVQQGSIANSPTNPPHQPNRVFMRFCPFVSPSDYFLEEKKKKNIFTPSHDVMFLPNANIC